MSRNGSGTYTLPAGNPVVTGTTISSTWANTTLTNIASALTDSLAADGQTTATGNLKMGNNRITGLADGIAATDAATVSQLPSAALFLLKASNLSDVANATTARGNLTAAKSGANSDITSLTGLTTPLTVAQGGTGAATLTANNVLLGNGTSAPQFVAPSTNGNVLTSNGTTWTSAALPAGGVTSLNGQTGNITNTTFGNIGNTATLLLFSTSTFKTNDTVSGSILYYPTTATYQASVDLITSQFSSTSVYTSVGSNVGSENATPTQKVLGNTGHVAPLGCSTVSGTWRIVSLTGRGVSSYDLCTNTTTVLYGQVMVVRVS